MVERCLLLIKNKERRKKVRKVKMGGEREEKENRSYFTCKGSYMEKLRWSKCNINIFFHPVGQKKLFEDH